MVSLNGKVLELNKDSIVSWYACGPTVYDSPHIGHARTYVMTDVIKRVLEYHNYNVIMGMNITDVDDKIIARAVEKSIGTGELTNTYEKEFWESMDKLNVQRPDIVMRATESIFGIIEMVTKLITDGMAYVANGSVYMDMTKYKESYDIPFDIQDEDDALHDNTFKSEKKHPSDFVLWKKSKGESMSWNSPWSQGRPGWHIECSAMATDMFRDISKSKLHIHSGGIDLKFPHHNNEIIQSTCFLGLGKEEKWVENFIHIGHLHIEGLKMSKSLKNFITIDKILEKYDPRVIRLLFLMHDLSKPMDYATDVMEFTNVIFDKFINFIKIVDNLRLDRNVMNRPYVLDYDDMFDKTFMENKMKILNNMSNLNTIPINIKLLTDLVSSFNAYVDGRNPHLSIVNKVHKFIVDMLSVYGLNIDSGNCSNDSEKYIDIILNIRKDVRDRKLYDLSDKIRDVYLKDLNIMDKPLSK